MRGSSKPPKKDGWSHGYPVKDEEEEREYTAEEWQAWEELLASQAAGEGEEWNGEEDEDWVGLSVYVFQNAVGSCVLSNYFFIVLGGGIRLK